MGDPVEDSFMVSSKPQCKHWAFTFRIFMCLKDKQQSCSYNFGYTFIYDHAATCKCSEAVVHAWRVIML